MAASALLPNPTFTLNDAGHSPARLPDDTRRFVVRTLERHAGRPRTVAVTVPAPRRDAEAFLAADPEAPAFFWDPGDGTARAGLGAVHRLEASGTRRFGEVVRQAAEITPRLVTAAAPGTDSPTPRFYGGLAFAPGTADDAPWRGFGDAVFVLPRLLYQHTRDGASLTLAVRGEEIGRLDAAAELERALTFLEDAMPRAPRPAVKSVERPERDAWYDGIEAIRHEIAAGRLRKVVAASRTRLELAGEADPAAVLERLGSDGVTRFAFRPGGESTFLGATPERLVARRGLDVRTEALAGSIVPGPGRAAALLESAKDRHEHQLVAEAIGARLAPLTAELEVPSSPWVRSLAHVCHLWTSIRATLASPRHVLELAEALHPTPAVGGVPTPDALDWIAAHESTPRGWYAAPVGWFDRDGDGELKVALRSAVLTGSEAHVYAGAGIVSGSDPEREYHEIETKKKTLLAALAG